MTLISEQNSHSSLFKTEITDEEKRKHFFDHRVIIIIMMNRKRKKGNANDN